MKRLAIILAAAAAAFSCDGNGLSVQDKSFSVKPEVLLSDDGYSRVLRLELTSGCNLVPYTITYDIDSDASLVLTDGGDGTVESGSEISFSESRVLLLGVPQLALGEHVIKVALTTEDYSQSFTLPVTVDIIPVSVHAEINASVDNPASVVLVSLQKGRTEVTYGITVAVDGQPVPGSPLEVDFTRTPIVSVKLPTIRPGSHTVTVGATDGIADSSVDLELDEPVRFPYLDITVSHNAATGNHEMTVSRNPYGIRVRAESLLTIDGSCTYWLGGNGWESYPTDWQYKTTKTMTVTDTRTVDTREAGTWCLAERDAKAEAVTTEYVMSAVWAEVCDSENCYWVVSRYEPVYYKITSESFGLTGEIESVPGVTARISGNIGGACWNGEPIGRTPMEIKL